MGIARGLGSIGRANEATETYHRVIEILESTRGEGEELILPLSALGNLLQKEGKASDAEYAYNRLALCIIITVYACRLFHYDDYERFLHCDALFCFSRLYQSS